ncbi:hypothetical protein AVEN_134908-1 [Araneus ventricosus]|uniref:Uncharacterized protein n=1 Tax=Araneus ventricosus TaxID=182803 RepID=A0A4Y2CH72_ARAVE|nr:hypothetical protein AVEN_134908-1 [Araneus ventricosus]
MAQYLSVKWRSQGGKQTSSIGRFSKAEVASRMAYGHIFRWLYVGAIPHLLDKNSSRDSYGNNGMKSLNLRRIAYGYLLWKVLHAFKAKHATMESFRLLDIL